MEAAGNALSGLEWAAGIPGTIGGAVFGNAGAYGHSISERVEIVRTLNEDLEILTYASVNCRFGYRDSIFKSKQEIILEVILKLEKGEEKEIMAKIKNILSDRKNRIPPYPSAGSIFKNINVSDLPQKENKVYTNKGIELPQEKIKGGKFPVAYLIEQCGLKGMQRGQAKISEQHANFIVNLGSAKSKDVLALINLCKERVREKFGIELKEEIRYLGF